MEDSCTGNTVSKWTLRKKSRSKTYCSAMNCGNAKFRKPEISYFRFPKDPERCRLWIINSGLRSLLREMPLESFNKTRLLCSEHFETSQFMNPDSKNKLIWKAIPSIFKHNRPVFQKEPLVRVPTKILPQSFKYSTSEAIKITSSEGRTENVTPKQVQMVNVLPNRIQMVSAIPNQFQLVNVIPNQIQVVNTLPNSIQMVNAIPNQIQVLNAIPNPIQVMNAIPNSLQMMNTITNPVQYMNTSTNQIQLADCSSSQVFPSNAQSDRTNVEEKNSARPRSTSPFRLTLHLTCESVSGDLSSDESASMEESSSSHDVYICCRLCHGLWLRDSFPSSHEKSCDGTIRKSSASLFSVDRSVFSKFDCHSVEMLSRLFVKYGFKNTCPDELLHSQQNRDSEDIMVMDNQPSDNGHEVMTVCDVASECQLDDELSSEVSVQCCDDIKRLPVSGRTLEIKYQENILVQRNDKTNTSSASDKNRSNLAEMSTFPAAASETACFNNLEMKRETGRELNSGEGIADKYREFLLEVTVGGRREKRYQCSLCRFSTRMVGFFDRHMRSCHDGHTTCKVCSSSFSTKALLRKHMNMHARQFMCEFCSMCFAEKREMQKHSWIHQAYMPYQCNECDYKCRYKRLLLEHSRKHTGDVLECEEPGCHFTTCYRWALKNHKVLKHSSFKKFSCESCDYQTNSKGSLKKHESLHNGRGDYVCHLCPYRAVVRHDLLRHLRKHTSEKIYFCDICSYSTAYSSSLHVHLMHHLQLKPWKCGECKFQAVTKQKVSRHMKKIHQNSDHSPVKTELQFNFDIKSFRRRSSSAINTKV